MVVRHGRAVDPGFLPIYSVDTEQEAEELLTAACQTNLQGEYIAEELLHEQTIDNLFAFGRRLEKTHRMIRVCYPVYSLLRTFGYAMDGRTKRYPVGFRKRSGCRSRAVLAMSIFGGRVRYRRGREYVTVGDLTTCFYRKAKRGGIAEITKMRRMRTRDIAEIGVELARRAK